MDRGENRPEGKRQREQTQRNGGKETQAKRQKNIEREDQILRWESQKRRNGGKIEGQMKRKTPKPGENIERRDIGIEKI